ncbi:MAG: sigma-70 family RNA polymerase sigma factor [Planctomycetota bacterium]|nr:sigma-70 family RNA polymerase sigma factor [Planctomycetota bacterium]
METFGERLVREFFDRLHGYVRMRVPAQDCEDVVGDIFLRAIERQEQLRGDAGPWLFAIARSQIADHYRQRESAMRTEDPLTASASATEDGWHCELARSGTAHAPAPLESLEQAEFRERLQRRMELLPELERDVIAFKFTDGLSNTEIAKVLGITPNHLGVVLHRALQRLRSAMIEGS